MRQSGERLLASFPKFPPGGDRESTTLADDASISVTAAQGGDWFDRGRTRSEFARILRRDGTLVLASVD